MWGLRSTSGPPPCGNGRGRPRVLLRRRRRRAPPNPKTGRRTVAFPPQLQSSPAPFRHQRMPLSQGCQQPTYRDVTANHAVSLTLHRECWRCKRRQRRRLLPGCRRPSTSQFRRRLRRSAPGQHIVGLEIRFDRAIYMARRKHRKSIAIAAIARQARPGLDPAECLELYSGVQ